MTPELGAASEATNKNGAEDTPASKRYGIGDKDAEALRIERAGS